MQVLQPPGWARPKGYANGVTARGTMVFVAGQVGWDETETFRSADFADQGEQALKNIVAILAQAGAGPQHIVRLTWFVTDTAEYLASQQRLGAAYRRVIGAHFPAMSVIGIMALYETGAKLEIEATAVIPD
ncbi:MAG: enamine deaminase RidA [Alphaproteobacteria bacterium HGW-Alphaproteobacteria-2]|nr:MAG: enamine deaminase RidA [Alphaproteobacteria bacterium HGW-Alphaproteobacteria-2]